VSDIGGWVAFLAAVHTFGAFAMTGVIWFVQVVQYPGFAKVGVEHFAEFHRHHCRAIGWIVGVLMPLELLTGATLAWGAAPVWFWRGMFGLLLIAWASTALWQGPLHRRLSNEGLRLKLVQELVAGNWLRTLVWTIRSVGLVWLYARGWAPS
jgi:hypothetical protein